MADGAATIKKVFLELGGKSAFIVLDDADLAGRGRHRRSRVCMHAGQGCAITTRLIVAIRFFFFVASLLVFSRLSRSRINSAINALYERCAPPAILREVRRRFSGRLIVTGIAFRDTGACVGTVMIFSQLIRFVNFRQFQRS